MTDDFIILDDAELEQFSGGTLPFEHPDPPGRPPHGGWRVGQPPISAITLFNNPEFYVRGTTTAKAF